MTDRTFTGASGPGDGHGAVDNYAIVVILDLRTDLHRARTERIESIQRAYRRKLGRENADASRLLVIDDADRLVEHGELVGDLIATGAVEHSLILALGRPHGGKLVLPRIGDERAVLWASDLLGLGWSPGRPGRILGDDTDDPTGARNLTALLQALSIPTVFDRVLTTTRGQRWRAATPAMHLVLGRVDRTSLDNARGYAISHFTEAVPGGSGVLIPQRSMDVGRLLSGRATLDFAEISTIMDPAGRGLLQQANDNAQAHLLAAQELVRFLREEPRGPLRPLPDGSSRPAGELIWSQLAGAGTHLRERVRLLTDAFREIGGSEGIAAPQRAQLADLGVQVVTVPPAEPGPVLEALRELTDTGLTAREPLAGVSRRLRELAERASPTGSAPRVPEIAQRCPERVYDVLLEPPRFPRRFVTGTLATGFLSTLLASLWSPLPGTVLGLLAGGVTTWLATALFRRRPIPQPLRDGDPRDLPKQTPLLVGLAAAAGLAVGLLVGGVALRPEPVAGLLFLGAGLFLVPAPLLWWRGAVDTWAMSLRLPEAFGALQALDELLLQVALNDWVLANQRIRTATTASRLADVVDAARAALEERRPRPGPGGPSARTASRTRAMARRDGEVPLGIDPDVGYRLSDRNSDLTQVLTGDVGWAVRAVLDQYDAEDLWQAEPEDIDRTVRRDLADRLDAYDEHLERRGPLADPPFRADPTRRLALARAVWKNSDALRRLRTAGSDDIGLLQLTGPDDLQLLNRQLGAAHLIRFVPDVAGADGEEGTGSPDIAGLIRLVPLMPDAATDHVPTGPGKAQSSSVPPPKPPASGSPSGPAAPPDPRALGTATPGASTGAEASTAPGGNPPAAAASVPQPSAAPPSVPPAGSTSSPAPAAGAGAAAGSEDVDVVVALGLAEDTLALTSAEPSRDTAEASGAAGPDFEPAAADDGEPAPQEAHAEPAAANGREDASDDTAPTLLLEAEPVAAVPPATGASGAGRATAPNPPPPASTFRPASPVPATQPAPAPAPAPPRRSGWDQDGELW